MLTQTFKMIMLKSPAELRAELPAALNHTIDKYSGQWERNMVAAYAETLTPSQLRQNCDAINAGDQSTVRKFATTAGERNREKSIKLVQDATSEVLGRLMHLL